MSNSKNLFITYCEKNNNIAEEINQKLKRVGIKFQLLGSDKLKGDDYLTNLILNQKDKGLLLLSDNFLKSEVCMQKMLAFINDPNAFGNIQVIIIDGKYPSKKGKGFETIETNFDRVSGVIKYMNFWQERYLDLRKEKRSIAPADAPVFEEKLNRVKAISAEIGDFLRLVRTKQTWTFEHFERNDFELFFKKYGDNGLYQKYQTVAANDPKKVTEPKPDLSEIPGMDLLREASEKDIVLPVLEEKVAEIDVNKIEKAIEPVAKKQAEPIVQDALTAITKKTSSEKQLATSTLQTSSSFEQKVEEIVEEVENDNHLVHFEKLYKNDNPDTKNKATEENSYETLAAVYDDNDDEEDITGDFDPMAEKLPEVVEEKIEEVVQNPEVPKNIAYKLNDIDVDKLIFDASNFVDAGDIDKAIDSLKDALKGEPENSGARYMYAMLLFNYKEDFDKAKKQLKKVVALDPQNCEAFEHLARIAELDNNFPLAKQYYERVIDLEPNTFGVYYKLGLITAGFFSEEKKQAYKYFKKAVKQDKSNEDAHYRLGILLNETFQKPKKAFKHFKTVLKLDPDHQFVYYDLALLCKQVGEDQKAALFYQKACKINPEIKTQENDFVFDYSEAEQRNEESDVKQEAASTPSDESEKEQNQTNEPGKVVFITGATSGIGKATAEVFAAKGYRLILTGRRADRLNDLQDEFEKMYDTDSLILPFDVRNIEEVKSTIDNLDEQWSEIDILINNAGLAKGYAPIHEGNLDHWETMIDTNIKGLLYLTRAIAPHMVKRQSGQIINICSSAGHEVYPNGNVYCATKFAVDALTKSMRLDLHKHNIRVGQVSPGHVEETEFALVRYEDQEKAKVYEDFQPLKSKDVAEVIYFMVTAPAHVTIQDVQMMGTQQASSNLIDRSGR